MPPVIDVFLCGFWVKLPEIILVDDFYTDKDLG